MKVLSIDPGDTTGWIYIEDPDTIMAYGNLKFDKITDFLGEWDYEKNPIDVFLVEDFRVFNKSAVRNGDRQRTTRVLGMVEVIAKMKKIRLVKQDSNVLPVAVRTTGIDPYKGKHKDTHWAFAYTHVAYYFTLLKLRKSAGQLAREKK